MRRGGFAFVLVVVGFLLAGGCGPETTYSGGCYCTTHTYQTPDVGPVAATGNVDLKGGSMPVVLDDPPPYGECRAYVAATSDDYFMCRDGPLPVDVSLTVLCEENQGYQPVNEGTADLGDIRDLGPGDHPVANVYWGGSSVHVTLRVEATSGSSAPYPELVTPDFNKALRFQMVGTDDFGAAIGASLTFKLKASDFRALPSQSCQQCAC